jgi:hypothetical protein
MSGSGVVLQMLHYSWIMPLSHVAVSPVLQLMLCGQTPEVIADTALTAINFYVEQQRLTGMYLNHQLTQKMDSIQQACKKKLVEMNGAFQTVCQLECMDYQQPL